MPISRGSPISVLLEVVLEESIIINESFNVNAIHLGGVETPNIEKVFQSGMEEPHIEKVFQSGIEKPSLKVTDTIPEKPRIKLVI